MAAGDRAVSLLGPFYYGTAGSQATTPVTNIRNVRFTKPLTFATATERATSGVPVEGSKPVKAECPTLEFQVLAKEADAWVTALLNAANSLTKIALRALDKSGGEGPDFDAYIEFGRDDEDDGLVVYNITAKHALDGRAFTWA